MFRLQTGNLFLGLFGLGSLALFHTRLAHKLIVVDAMSIHGTLKTMSVSDLLQFLALGRKTGTLNRTRPCRKQIFLENGVIVGSSSNDPKEFLGQVLLHYGKITEDQLQEALEIQRHSVRSWERFSLRADSSARLM